MARLFPYMHIHDVFSQELNTEILAYAIKEKENFKPSVVYSKGVQRVSDSRISQTLMDCGPYRKIIQENISKLIPAMVENLKISKFEIGEIEVQLAAHGDGALFATHIDTAVHEKTDNPRIISAVYYFHSIPKKFKGGDLRLHTIPIGEEDVDPKDISPDNNSLLAFPSFSPHEVLPVIAPGVEFEDWRFAVNCWIHKA